MQEQMDSLKEMLSGMGVEYEQHAPFVNFDNGDGECMVFPSLTYDGKLVVRYTRKVWCDTAEEALKACGLCQ